MKKQKSFYLTLPPIHCTAAQLAELLEVSPRWIKHLRAEGAAITETVDGRTKYNLIETLTAYIRFLKRDDETAQSKRRALKAIADYREHKAALLDLELKKRKGQLHEARHIRAIWTQNLTEIRAAFRAIPNRLAPELATCGHDTRAIASALKKEIDGTLHQLANREYDPEEFKRLVEADGESIFDEDGDEDETSDGLDIYFGKHEKRKPGTTAAENGNALTSPQDTPDMFEGWTEQEIATFTENCMRETRKDLPLEPSAGI